MTAKLVVSQSPRAARYESHLRRPGDPAVAGRIVIDAIERPVRRHLALNTSKHTRDRAPRILAIAGRPGTGKSFVQSAAALAFGHAIIELPGATFASDVEGGANTKLIEVLEDGVMISHRDRLRVALILHDFELGIAADDGRTTRTVNSPLYIGLMQNLADERHRFRNFDGSNIALLINGNDFTTLRSSLLRPGRATVVTYEPDPATALALAARLLGPATPADHMALKKLVWRHRAEPLSFWPQLKADHEAILLDGLLGDGAPDLDRLDEALSRPKPFDAALLWHLAETRARAKPGRFL
jgi:hypothetical protein